MGLRAKTHDGRERHMKDELIEVMPGVFVRPRWHRLLEEAAEAFCGGGVSYYLHEVIRAEIEAVRCDIESSKRGADDGRLLVEKLKAMGLL